MKITDIKTFDNSEMQDILTNSVSQSEFEKSYDNIKSAKFHVLRDGSVFTCNIACEKFTPVSPNFEFVEYYFGDGLTNISTSNVGTAATNTKEARKLEELKNLPDTGYIRIKEFSYILSDGETADDEPKHTVVSEFVEVMEMFANINSKKVEGRTPLKHLILDLKGNPGGNVQYTAQIAGMLITDAKLNDAELKTVSVGGKKRLITQLINKQGVSSPYSVELTYNTYFGAPTDKADIVVWTDGGSASASELLTGALLDYRTAVQMGTKTYGKGIAQTWKELTNYTGTFIVDGKPVTSCWAIYYTVAEYRSPVTNTNIHGLGYTPKVYDGLDTYEKLWEATIDYFNSATSGTGDGVLAAA